MKRLIRCNDGMSSKPEIVSLSLGDGASRPDYIIPNTFYLEAEDNQGDQIYIGVDEAKKNNYTDKDYTLETAGQGFLYGGSLQDCITELYSYYIVPDQYSRQIEALVRRY